MELEGVFLKSFVKKLKSFFAWYAKRNDLWKLNRNDKRRVQRAWSMAPVEAVSGKKPRVQNLWGELSGTLIDRAEKGFSGTNFWIIKLKWFTIRIILRQFWSVFKDRFKMEVNFVLKRIAEDEGGRHMRRDRLLNENIKNIVLKFAEVKAEVILRASIHRSKKIKRTFL